MINLKRVTVALAVLALSAACGSQTARTSTSSSGSTASGAVSNAGATLGSSSSGNIYNLPAAPSQNLTISGTSGPYPTVSYRASTSRTLKVKVSAMAAPNLTIPGYTNWVFPYGCMQVTVTANGMPLTTQYLRVGSQAQTTNSRCANAPTYQILDFSNAMTGSGSVLITVSNPQYDNCRYQNPLAYGCGMSAVWSNHLVQANFTTQVDGYWMDP